MDTACYCYNQQSTKNKKLPTTTLVKQGWQGYLISPGDIYTDPVSAEPQFSCFQMVYWHILVISYNILQYNVYQGLEGFHADIVQHSSTKVINFTSVSKNFILKLFWMIWQNCSISPQSRENFRLYWQFSGFFERILYQHSWERIHNDFVLDCSKKILEFTIPSGVRNSIFL